jgi:inorganic pyrophosphatase
MNVWHDVSVGDNPPELVNAIIEITRGSRAKYEIDKETGLLMLDRILHSTVHYPANYGLIPQTLGEDNDPLDVMVLSYADTPPLCLVPSRIIGVMGMIDGGEGDDKLIAVANDDVTVTHINDISDVPQQQLDEISDFFGEYKRLEKKKVEITGIQGKAEAYRIIKEGIERYNKKFG